MSESYWPESESDIGQISSLIDPAVSIDQPQVSDSTNVFCNGAYPSRVPQSCEPGPTCPKGEEGVRTGRRRMSDYARSCSLTLAIDQAQATHHTPSLGDASAEKRESSLRRHNLARNLGLESPPNSGPNSPGASPRSGSHALLASDASTGCSSPLSRGSHVTAPSDASTRCSSPLPLDISYLRPPVARSTQSKGDDILAKLKAFDTSVSTEIETPSDAHIQRLSKGDIFDSAQKRLQEKVKLLQLQTQKRINEHKMIIEEDSGRKEDDKIEDELQRIKRKTNQKRNQETFVVPFVPASVKHAENGFPNLSDVDKNSADSDLPTED